MTLSRGLLLPLVGAALGACATTKSPSTNVTCDVVDCARVAAINHAARMRGVRVIWVAQPQKRETEQTRND